VLEAAIDWTDLRVVGAEDGAGRPVDLVETIGEGSWPLGRDARGGPVGWAGPGQTRVNGRLRGGPGERRLYQYFFVFAKDRK
jgi:hypothetical protein